MHVTALRLFVTFNRITSRCMCQTWHSLGDFYIMSSLFTERCKLQISVTRHLFYLGFFSLATTPNVLSGVEFSGLYLVVDKYPPLNLIFIWYPASQPIENFTSKPWACGHADRRPSPKTRGIKLRIRLILRWSVHRLSHERVPHALKSRCNIFVLSLAQPLSFLPLMNILHLLSPLFTPHA